MQNASGYQITYIRFLNGFENKYHELFLIGRVSLGVGGVSGFVSRVSWLVGGVGRFVVVGLGVTVVFHISDVSVVIGLVGDRLVATVGESDVVRAGDVFAVAGLRVAKVVVVVVLHFVVEAVRLGRLF